MDGGAHQRGSGFAKTFLCIVGSGGGGEPGDDIQL